MPGGARSLTLVAFALLLSASVTPTSSSPSTPAKPRNEHPPGFSFLQTTKGRDVATTSTFLPSTHPATASAGLHPPSPRALPQPPPAWLGKPRATVISTASLSPPTLHQPMTKPAPPASFLSPVSVLPGLPLTPTASPHTSPYQAPRMPQSPPSTPYASLHLLTPSSLPPAYGLPSSTGVSRDGLPAQLIAPTSPPPPPTTSSPPHPPSASLAAAFPTPPAPFPFSLMAGVSRDGLPAQQLHRFQPFFAPYNDL